MTRVDKVISKFSSAIKELNAITVDLSKEIDKSLLETKKHNDIITANQKEIDRATTIANNINQNILGINVKDNFVVVDKDIKNA